MSELDLSSNIEQARDAVAKSAEQYVSAQEQMAVASEDLAQKQQKLRRLEKALAILNGEEEPVASAPAAAGATAPATTPAPAAATAPASSPPPKQFVPQGPYAQVKCSACGEVGQMSEIYKPTKAGTMAHLLVCGDCNNEVYLG